MATDDASVPVTAPSGGSPSAPGGRIGDAIGGFVAGLYSVPEGIGHASLAGVGVLLSALNPKNLTLAAGAGLALAQGSLDAVQSVVAVVVFVAIGSLSIAVQVGYSLFGGASAQQTLDGWKTWLGVHNAAVMTVVLLVIGAVLAGKGLAGIV
jgi:hypothetical protein